MLDSRCLTQNHILCTNLVYFEYFVKVLRETNHLQAVDFPVKLPGHRKTIARIDIVSSDGTEWIKVIARNPKALNDVAFGKSNYGSKSILDHGKLYNEIAKGNPQYFQIPKVIFESRYSLDCNLFNNFLIYFY